MRPTDSVARTGGPGPLRPRRVLIVEDNRDCAESLRLVFEIAGHDVQVANSGPAGVEIGLQWRPDVVFCDLGLPGRDGFEVAEELRLKRADHVRLIAVSAYAGDDVAEKALARGFDAVLTKPADPSDLLRIASEGA
jgi:CheY-like chemotaxis protein